MEDYRHYAETFERAAVSFELVNCIAVCAPLVSFRHDFIYRAACRSTVVGETDVHSGRIPEVAD